MAKKKINRFISTTFPLDGTIIEIRVHRFTADELTDELTAFQEISSGPADDEPARAMRRTAEADRFRDLIRRFVTLGPDELEDPDGCPVLTGAQLVALFPGREDIVTGLGMLVFSENRMSEGQKRDFRLRVGSALGWPAWSGTPSGDAPEPTADAVSAPGSNGSAGATFQPTPRAAESSGATEPSTSDAVPSAA